MSCCLLCKCRGGPFGDVRLLATATGPVHDQQQLVGFGLGDDDTGTLELVDQAGQMRREGRGQLPLELEQTATFGTRLVEVVP